jgi:hypothetical protein
MKAGKQQLLVESAIEYLNLGMIAELRFGMAPQEADFYLVATDYIENIGKVVTEPGTEKARIGVKVVSGLIDPEMVKRNLIGLYKSGYLLSFEAAMFRIDPTGKDSRIRVEPEVLALLPLRLEIPDMPSGLN